MAKKLKPTSDAVEILHRRVYESKPARLKNLEEARADEEIARKIPKLSSPLQLSATYLLALAVWEAIHTVAGDWKNISDPKVLAAFQIARLIRNAFVHNPGPFAPVWAV